MSGHKLKLGIVGCGSATQIEFAPIMRFVDQCELTALCDPVPEALDLVRSIHPVEEVYRDYGEFLRRAKVDAVIIATPVYLHKEQVVKAAGAGKHVLCEKPMARTLAECDEMIAACQNAGVTLMVGFMKRFDKSMRHAKALIDQGRLGKPYHLLCDWRSAANSQREFQSTARSEFWRAKLLAWGGIYQDHASHTSDLSRWWLGEIVSVSAEMSIVGQDQEVEDYGVGVYVHESGAKSVHLMGVSQMGINERYQIDGSQATLEIQYGPPWSFTSTDPFRMTVYEESGRRRTDETQYNHSVLSLELARSGRYKRELDHFCECVLEGKTPLVTGENGRKAIEAINAAYLSAFLKEKVHLPLEQTPELERFFVELKARSSFCPTG